MRIIDLNPELPESEKTIFYGFEHVGADGEPTITVINQWDDNEGCELLIKTARTFPGTSDDWRACVQLWANQTCFPEREHG